MTERALSLIFFGVILVFIPATPARAAGPRIKQITMDGREVSFGVAGAVLLLAGEGFGSTAAAVSATAGGDAALVLEVTDTRCRIMLPSGIRPGIIKIHVKVGGSTSNAATFEVVGLEEYRKRGGLTRERAQEKSEEAEVQFRLLIINRVAEAQERGKVKIVVTGRTREIPDSSLIHLSLLFSGEEVGTASAQVNQAIFEGQFGPFEKTLPAGSYLVKASFSLRRQPRGIRRDLIRRAQVDGKDPESLTDEAGAAIEIGTRDAIARQREDERGHHSRILDRAEALLADLENHFRAGLKASFRKPDGTSDISAWKEFLKTHYFEGLGEADRIRRTEELDTLAGGLLTAEGKLDTKRWREWLDGKFRASLVDLAQQHRRFTDRWLAVRFPRVHANVSQAPGFLLGISASWSMDLYKRCGLPPATQDLEPQGADIMTIPPSRARSTLVEAIRDARKRLQKPD